MYDFNISLLGNGYIGGVGILEMVVKMNNVGWDNHTAHIFLSPDNYLSRQMYIYQATTVVWTHCAVEDCTFITYKI